MPTIPFPRFASATLLALAVGACSTPEQYEITFSSDRDESMDLYGITADSTEFRRYTRADGTEADPDWSPDGRRLAFTAWIGPNAEIVALDPGTGTIEPLVQNPAFDADPDWMPDGSAVVFVSDRGGTRALWRAGIADGTVARLSRDGDTDVAPAVSPDGSLVAFSRLHTDGSGHARIFLMAADGTGARPLSSGSGLDGHPSWSPGGERLAFQRCLDGRCALWVIDADGSNEVPLRSDEDDHRAPAWSPDGAWIAFASRRAGGASDLWVVKPDGTGERRVTGWPGSDEGATWNPLIPSQRKPPVAD